MTCVVPYRYRIFDHVPKPQNGLFKLSERQASPSILSTTS
jgi:hypothetical protein